MQTTRHSHMFTRERDFSLKLEMTAWLKLQRILVNC